MVCYITGKLNIMRYYPPYDYDYYYTSRRRRYMPYYDRYYSNSFNQIANVDQYIYNSGYMNDVYQSSVINQTYPRIRR